MQYLDAPMLMCLLVAGSLGLFTGWLLWGTSVRRARERVREMEQRASKLSGYPSRLSDLEGTYAALVASKNEESARYKARIAELEKLAESEDRQPLKALPRPQPVPDFMKSLPSQSIRLQRDPIQRVNPKSVSRPRKMPRSNNCEFA